MYSDQSSEGRDEPNPSVFVYQYFIKPSDCQAWVDKLNTLPRWEYLKQQHKMLRRTYNKNRSINRIRGVLFGKILSEELDAVVGEYAQLFTREDHTSEEQLEQQIKTIQAKLIDLCWYFQVLDSIFTFRDLNSIDLHVLKNILLRLDDALLYSENTYLIWRIMECFCETKKLGFKKFNYSLYDTEVPLQGYKDQIHKHEEKLGGAKLDAGSASRIEIIKFVNRVKAAMNPQNQLEIAHLWVALKAVRIDHKISKAEPVQKLKMRLEMFNFGYTRKDALNNPSQVVLDPSKYEYEQLLLDCIPLLQNNPSLVDVFLMAEVRRFLSSQNLDKRKHAGILESFLIKQAWLIQESFCKRAPAEGVITHFLEPTNAFIFINLIVATFYDLEFIFHNSSDIETYKSYIQMVEFAKQCYLSYGEKIWWVPIEFQLKMNIQNFREFQIELDSEIRERTKNMITRFNEDDMPIYVYYDPETQSFKERKTEKMEFLEAIKMYLKDCRRMQNNFLEFPEPIPTDLESSILLVELVKIRFHDFEPNRQQKDYYTTLLQQVSLLNVTPRFRWYENDQSNRINRLDRQTEFYTFELAIKNRDYADMVRQLINQREIQYVNSVSNEVNLIDVLESIKFCRGIDVSALEFNVREEVLFEVLSLMTSIMDSSLHLQDPPLQEYSRLTLLHLCLYVYNLKVKQASGSLQYQSLAYRVMVPYMTIPHEKTKRLAKQYPCFFDKTQVGKTDKQGWYAFVDHVLPIADALADCLANSADTLEGLKQKMVLFINFLTCRVNEDSKPSANKSRKEQLAMELPEISMKFLSIVCAETPDDIKTMILYMFVPLSRGCPLEISIKSILSPEFLSTGLLKTLLKKKDNKDLQGLRNINTIEVIQKVVEEVASEPSYGCISYEVMVELINLAKTTEKGNRIDFSQHIESTVAGNGVPYLLFLAYIVSHVIHNQGMENLTKLRSLMTAIIKELVSRKRDERTSRISLLPILKNDDKNNPVNMTLFEQIKSSDKPEQSMVKQWQSFVQEFGEPQDVILPVVSIADFDSSRNTDLLDYMRLFDKVKLPDPKSFEKIKSHFSASNLQESVRKCEQYVKEQSVNKNTVRIVNLRIILYVLSLSSSKNYPGLHTLKEFVMKHSNLLPVLLGHAVPDMEDTVATTNNIMIHEIKKQLHNYKDVFLFGLDCVNRYRIRENIDQLYNMIVSCEPEVYAIPKHEITTNKEKDTTDAMEDEDGWESDGDDVESIGSSSQGSIRAKERKLNIKVGGQRNIQRIQSENYNESRNNRMNQDQEDSENDISSEEAMSEGDAEEDDYSMNSSSQSGYVSEEEITNMLVNKTPGAYEAYLEYLNLREMLDVAILGDYQKLEKQYKEQRMTVDKEVDDLINRIYKTLSQVGPSKRRIVEKMNASLYRILRTDKGLEEREEEIIHESKHIKLFEKPFEESSFQSDADSREELEQNDEDEEEEMHVIEDDEQLQIEPPEAMSEEQEEDEDGGDSEGSVAKSKDSQQIPGKNKGKFSKKIEFTPNISKESLKKPHFTPRELDKIIQIILYKLMLTPNESADKIFHHILRFVKASPQILSSFINSGMVLIRIDENSTDSVYLASYPLLWKDYMDNNPELTYYENFTLSYVQLLGSMSSTMIENNYNEQEIPIESIDNLMEQSKMGKRKNQISLLTLAIRNHKNEGLVEAIDSVLNVFSITPEQYFIDSEEELENPRKAVLSTSHIKPLCTESYAKLVKIHHFSHVIYIIDKSPLKFFKVYLKCVGQKVLEQLNSIHQKFLMVAAELSKDNSEKNKNHMFRIIHDVTELYSRQFAIFYYSIKDLLNRVYSNSKEQSDALVAKLAKNEELIQICTLAAHHLVFINKHFKDLKGITYDAFEVCLDNELKLFDIAPLIYAIYGKKKRVQVQPAEMVQKYLDVCLLHPEKYPIEDLEQTINLVQPLFELDFFCIPKYQKVVLPSVMKNPKSGFHLHPNFRYIKLNDEDDSDNQQTLHIRRDCSFDLAFHQLKQNRFRISYFGEEGNDQGGLRREFMIGWQGTGVHEESRFIGKILAIAYKEELLYGGKFDLAMAIALTGTTPTLQLLEEADPELYNQLKWLENNPAEDLCLTFSRVRDIYGEKIVEDLIPDGRNVAVTDTNKGEYIKKIVNAYFFAGREPEMIELKEGFYSVVSERYAKILTPIELIRKISGVDIINLQQLKKNVSYEGYSAGSEIVRWFWAEVEAFSFKEKQTFLQFLTGSHKLPLGLKNYSFTIERVFDTTRLPVAHTCFNTLDLPEYPTQHQFIKRFRTAVFQGNDTYSIM